MKGKKTRQKEEIKLEHRPRWLSVLEGVLPITSHMDRKGNLSDPTPISHWMRAIPGRAWAWARGLSAAEPDTWRSWHVPRQLCNLSFLEGGSEWCISMFTARPARFLRRLPTSRLSAGWKFVLGVELGVVKGDLESACKLSHYSFYVSQYRSPISSVSGFPQARNVLFYSF